MLRQEQKQLSTARLTSSRPWQNHIGTIRQGPKEHEEKLPEERQENEPVRKRDRTAEGKAETCRGE